jgi:hypothetical protein
VKHKTYETSHGSIISLGWDREHFGGTDTLGNTAITVIEPWLPTLSNITLFGEGDRLANARFFNYCRSLGNLKLFYLNTHPDLAAYRRQQRSLQTGKPQNETWVKGRATKHRNLANQFNAIEIPSGLTPAEGAALMWTQIIS